MAVEHRVDSIIKIKNQENDAKKGVLAIGKQLTKVTVELATKEKTIEALGQQAAKNMLEMAKLKREIAELKKGDK